MAFPPPVFKYFSRSSGGCTPGGCRTFVRPLRRPIAPSEPRTPDVVISSPAALSAEGRAGWGGSRISAAVSPPSATRVSSSVHLNRSVGRVESIQPARDSLTRTRPRTGIIACRAGVSTSPAGLCRWFSWVHGYGHLDSIVAIQGERGTRVPRELLRGTGEPPSGDCRPSLGIATGDDESARSRPRGTVVPRSGSEAHGAREHDRVPKSGGATHGSPSPDWSEGLRESYNVLRTGAERITQTKGRQWNRKRS